MLAVYQAVPFPLGDFQCRNMFPMRVPSSRGHEAVLMCNQFLVVLELFIAQPFSAGV